MTYIILGLGNFGLALAQKLTSLGHDVFGVDSHMEIVEEYKTSITSTICLNITDPHSLRSLPLQDADAVVVTMSENVGESLLVCAFLKQANVKHIVARASNLVHKTVLETMGVEEIISPESYAADLWALSSELEQIKGAYMVSNSYQILELEIPSILESQTLEEAKIEENFHVQLLCVKRRFTKENFLKSNTTYYEVTPTNDKFTFQLKDRIVVYGDNINIKQLKKALYQ